MEQSRQKKSNGLLFFVVGLCFTAVVAVSLFTSASRSEKNVENPIGSNSSADSVTDSAAVKTQLDSKNESKEKSSVNETIASETIKESESSEKIQQSEKQEAVNAESLSPSGKDEPLASYGLPVNGTLNKSYEVELPVFSLTMNDYRAHTGIDIGCDEGSGVCSVADGVVKEIFNDPMMGMSLTIEHAGGVESHYSNLAETLPSDITVGALVKQGQLVGAVGSSAIVEIAEEPHLHYEMTLGGALVDPLDYIALSAVSVFGENVGETQD